MALDESIESDSAPATDARDRVLELDAIAWNLPRPVPARYAPDDAWPEDTDTYGDLSERSRD